MQVVESTLEITTVVGCDIGCQVCPQAKLLRAYHHKRLCRQMTLATFEWCIDKVPPWVQIDFSGFAEPWLNSCCTEMVEYAASSHPIYIYTTLVGMTYRDAKRVAQVQPKHIGIHIRDVDDKSPIHDANLLLAETLRPTEYISHGEPHPSVVPCLLPGVHVSRCQLNSRAGSNWPTPYRHGPLRCSSTRRYRHNVLLPNGDVVLCCMDYGLTHRLGNLLTDSYESLFAAGTEYARIEQSALSGEPILCRECELAERPPQGA